jgi:PTS system glucose-specific IIC component
MEQVQAKTFDTNDGQSTLKKENKNKGIVKEFIAKLSKGLMLPIAILPIAGLFLGIGATIGSYYTGASVGAVIGKLISAPGNIIFGALPVLFAVAIAISFTKDAGAAGLSALVGWLVFNAVQSAFIISTLDDHGKLVSAHFLWYSFNADEYNAIFGTNIGIPSLSTSVFGGICVGLMVAFLYNKFKNIALPNILGFFSGIRFIPIVTFGGTFVMGLLFSMV